MATVKKAPSSSLPEIADIHKIKQEGMQLLTPLAPARALRVVTATDYLDADEWLGRVRNARLKWKSMVDPVKAPLDRIAADTKLALQGVKNLTAAVDGPLESMELGIKESMRQFKLEEQRQLRAAEEEQRRLEQEQQRAIEEAKRKEAAAKTAPMRAKLAAARETLETQAAQTAAVDLNPVVKGASSASRSVVKPTVTDLHALLDAMQDYQPLAGMYRMGVPPVSLISVEMVQVAINKLYREQPGVVASWPGITITDDIIIAGR
jgi:hypothetical protein